MTDSPEDYKQRQKDWRDITVNQLSLTNNILITVVTGYFVLIFDKIKVSQIDIDFQAKIDWNLLFYVTTLLLVLFSIILGVCVLFSRLYDFKISRHVALTRQRFHKKYSKGLPDHDFTSINSLDRLKSLFSILFIKIRYLTKQDIENFNNNKDLFKDRFNNLRRQSEILGTASWRWTKLQVGLTLLSIVTYVIHLTW